MKTGILLTNLGTPDSPTKPAVRRYLAQFLSDNRVVDPPNKLIWWLALNVIILNIRPKRSAKNYAKIWTRFGTGSPLLDISYLQLKSIKKTLLNKNDNLEFAIGMRYGNPSISSALQVLQFKKCEKIIVLPLYPQYSNTTTLSTLDAVNDALKTWKTPPKLTFIDNYHQNLAYIQALANSVIEHQTKHNKPDKLMISFHGIPQRYVDNGDVYYEQCVKTTQLLTAALGLRANEYQLCFQSIFGREKWLEPHTKTSLELLAAKGVSHVQVICPGFSADCLETLEEIDDENRAYFIQAGGKKFSYISALNNRSEHIQMLADICEKQL